MPQAVDCHIGIPASWLRCATRLPSIENSTLTIVKTAPSTGRSPSRKLPSSGANTSPMPAIPRTEPAAIRAVIGVPKNSRWPNIPIKGLAENPTATSPDTTCCSAKYTKT